MLINRLYIEPQAYSVTVSSAKSQKGINAVWCSVMKQKGAIAIGFV